MSGLDNVIDVFNEHPYLWALYPLMLVLPFVLVAAFCVPLREVCFNLAVCRHDSDFAVNRNSITDRSVMLLSQQVARKLH